MTTARYNCSKFRGCLSISAIIILWLITAWYGSKTENMSLIRASVSKQKNNNQHCRNARSQRRRNRGGNGGARPRNAETARAKVSFRPRNNLQAEPQKLE